MCLLLDYKLLNQNHFLRDAKVVPSPMGCKTELEKLSKNIQCRWLLSNGGDYGKNMLGVFQLITKSLYLEFP